MQQLDLKDMSLDELWTLHERISSLLSARILAEKHELEKRLAYLNRGTDARQGAMVKLLHEGANRPRQRRKYPRAISDKLAAEFSAALARHLWTTL